VTDNVDDKGGRQSEGNQGASEIQLCVLVRFTAFWRGMVRSGTERWGSTVLQEGAELAEKNECSPEMVWRQKWSRLLQIGPDWGSGIWTNLES
jgi:hypothetical protein